MRNIMKTMLLVVVMIFSTSITAQITGGEYWIDGDIAARKALSPGTTIDISSLSPGLHKLTVRVKDSKGLWSNQIARLFYVMPDAHADATSVAAAEYWIDDVKQTTATTLNTQVIDISQLDDGLHKLMVRVKDNKGVWSNQMTRTFFVSSAAHADATSITAREFWIDGKIADRQKIDDTPAVIDISSLPAGLHMLTMRVQDNNGVWSNQMARMFYVASTPEPSDATLVNYLYWIDGDKEHKVMGTIDDSHSLTIDIGDLEEGDHTFTWYVSDSKGRWSDPITEVFAVVECSTLTYMVDGEIYKTYEVPHGSAISPEEEPTKDGYTFSGWSDIPETMPNEDVTITGTFTFVDAIESVTTNDDVTPKRIYTPSGTPAVTLQKGLNIILMEDGTTKKVYVK
ncbi:MAG: InlB B-repeat-containing protein [Bacteroidaceae bacterium]|nr:InlB B-repeat-containing protein [Bacteroidaceae bacterium]